MVALADRMRAIKGQQVANLAYAREREIALAMPEQALAPAERVPKQRPTKEKSAPKVRLAVAPAFVDPTMEENIAYFRELYPVIMDFWGCDADERAHIRAEWIKPPAVGHMVREWMKQAVTHNLTVPEALSKVAYQIFHVDVMLPHLAERQIRIATGELVEEPVNDPPQPASKALIGLAPVPEMVATTDPVPAAVMAAIALPVLPAHSPAPVGSDPIELPPARKRRFGK